MKKHELFNIIRDSYGSPCYAMAYSEKEAMELCKKFRNEDSQHCNFIAIEIDEDEIEKVF